MTITTSEGLNVYMSLIGGQTFVILAFLSKEKFFFIKIYTAIIEEKSGLVKKSSARSSCQPSLPIFVSRYINQENQSG